MWDAGLRDFGPYTLDSQLCAKRQRDYPYRWARNQPPTASTTTPRISNSLPTTRVGRTIRAMPPSVNAAQVVTLPMINLSGGYTSDPRPNTNRPTPTQTIPLRLESLAPNSRAVSFWAAPNSAAA